MNKKGILIIAIVSVMVIASTISIVFWPNDKVVLKIGNTNVTESEFLMIFNNEVRTKYVAYADLSMADIWETEYQGRKLKEQVLEETIAKLLEYRAKQELFDLYKVNDWTYENFKKSYKKKIEDRKENDEILYGVQNFDEYNYYVYLTSIYELDVREKLKDSETDAQKIYDFYIDNASQFRGSDSFVFDYYKIDKSVTNAEQLLKKAVGGNNSEEVSYRQVVFNGNTSKYEQPFAYELGENIEGMRFEGAEIFTENEHELLYIRTVSYQQGEVRDYTDCKDTVTVRYYSAMFEKLVEEKMQDLEIIKTKYFSQLNIS